MLATLRATDRTKSLGIALALLTLVALATGPVVWALEQPARIAQATPPGTLLREGDQISGLAGQFHSTGPRYTFRASDEREFVVLENLALERVTRVLVNRPDAAEWVVAGKVTEFQGGNYLLITHAVRKGRVAPRRTVPTDLPSDKPSINGDKTTGRAGRPRR